MRDRLRDYALVAEIVSAFAIVVSLIFVGLEIRQNTNATYAVSYDRLLADQAVWRMELARDPGLLAAWNEAEGTDLTPYDRAKQALMQLYERAYFARTYGRLGDAEWDRFERIICRPSAVVPETGPYSTEFLQYLAACQNQ